MSVSTYPASWPTEARFKPLEEACVTAFNELEGLVGYLGSVTDPIEDTGWPDPLPTFETLGILWSGLEGIRMDIDQLTREADKLESLLGDINELRRDGPLAERSGDAS